LDTVKAIHESLGTGDIPAILAHLAPNVAPHFVVASRPEAAISAQ
jgi:hypothetical protein